MPLKGFRNSYRAPVPTGRGGCAPQERASELLRTLLTPDELKHFNRTGVVTVEGPISGRTWRLANWSVSLEAASRTERGRFPYTHRGAACCIHIGLTQRDALRPGDIARIEPGDNTIVQLLAIKTNERAFVWAIPSLLREAKFELVGIAPSDERHLIEPHYLRRVCSNERYLPF